MYRFRGECWDDGGTTNWLAEDAAELLLRINEFKRGEADVVPWGTVKLGLWQQPFEGAVDREHAVRRFRAWFRRRYQSLFWE